MHSPQQQMTSFTQSVIIELGIITSVEGIKLHLHTDSASGKAMVSKPGMSKKSKHIELKHLHLQGLIEAGIITVHKIGTLNNPSDIFTKFMPQTALTRSISAKWVLQREQLMRSAFSISESRSR
eukprot:423625-Amphidinium_carterae.5